MGQFESAHKKGKKPMNEMPKHVRRAVITGDVEQLRQSGRKGAEVTNEIKARKAAENEYYDEKLQLEEVERLKQTNEDILPANPEEEAA